MDELIARMAASAEHARKPEYHKVGVNDNYHQKPDFQKNSVQHAFSVVNDISAFNADGPSQLLSPTGMSDASFLHRRFDSKTIVTGHQPHIAAGASRIPLDIRASRE